MQDWLTNHKFFLVEEFNYDNLIEDKYNIYLTIARDDYSFSRTFLLKKNIDYTSLSSYITKTFGLSSVYFDDSYSYKYTKIDQNTIDSIRLVANINEDNVSYCYYYTFYLTKNFRINEFVILNDKKIDIASAMIADTDFTNLCEYDLKVKLGFVKNDLPVQVDMEIIEDKFNESFI